MKPYYQGALDGLCAVYSIVNATRIVNGIGEEGSKGLFQEIIFYLDDKIGLSRVLMSGIGLNTIGGIFTDVVGEKIKNRSMPFKHHPNTPLDEFWCSMKTFLDEGEKRAILIGLGGVWDHWSIVDTITEKQIRFFDSHKLRRLNRGRCTTVRATSRRPHMLQPTHTYFLS